jgi:hypothetical protein
LFNGITETDFCCWLNDEKQEKIPKHKIEANRFVFIIVYYLVMNGTE